MNQKCLWLILHPSSFLLPRRADHAMKRIVGILVLVLVLYGLILASSPQARTLQNHQRIAERLALYGILTVGAGILIVSGGIDLSIGSVFGLAAVGLGLLLQNGIHGGLAVLLVLGGGALIGAAYGGLITKLRLQPFIVTLCGLFIYRGMAYWLALPEPGAPLRRLARFLSFGALYGDRPIGQSSAGNVGIGEISGQHSTLVFVATGYPDFPTLSQVPVIGYLFSFISAIPVRLWLLAGLACLVALLMHKSVYGRYLYAIGSNEQAARYAGVATDRYKVLAYVLCAMLAALGGMLQLLELKTSSPSSTGQWYELYAITGAVLGGCSLRGGEGTVIGMLLGTAVLPLLRNLINFSGVPDDLEFTVIGFALLLGTITDELLKRRGAKRG
jgi:ribose transport system permease protein